MSSGIGGGGGGGNSDNNNWDDEELGFVKDGHIVAYCNVGGPKGTKGADRTTFELIPKVRGGPSEKRI